jgi:glycosyltransferase involved in cell wall biosynthesis
MRIGLFTNNYRPLANGLATSVETFAQAFRRAGHAVTVVAPRYGPGIEAEPDVVRVPGLRAPTHHAYVLPLSGWPGVTRAILSLDLDLFHAQHPFLLGAAAGRLARRLGRPLVFTYHTHYDRYAHYIPGPSRLVARLAVRRALAFANRADLVIAPTAAVARELRVRGLRTRVEVVPTGVTLSPIFTEADRREARHALGLGQGDPLYLSVGRLAREKNHAFLLSAFAVILAELPTARLVLVGEGDDRPRLERMASGLGIKDRVRFVGAVPHEIVGTYHQAADLFLFSSTSETQGLVVLEALAAGLPVVAVSSEAVEDLLQAEGGGATAPEDPAAFAGQALTLWRQSERRQTMRLAGRRIAARFAPDAMAARMLELYQDLVEACPTVPLQRKSPRSQEVKT